MVTYEYVEKKRNSAVHSMGFLPVNSHGQDAHAIILFCNRSRPSRRAIVRPVLVSPKVEAPLVVQASSLLQSPLRERLHYYLLIAARPQGWRCWWPDCDRLRSAFAGCTEVNAWCTIYSGRG